MTESTMTAACLRCGDPLPASAGGPPRKWCSRQCQRPQKPGVMRECVNCGATFESRRGMTRCSLGCRRERDRESLRRSTQRIGTSHASRARHYGVAYESVARLDVYLRDAWMCGICCQPVDRTKRHPDPMSASLDHVVPLSRGGTHTWANVQLAHLICNIEKGARV